MVAMVGAGVLAGPGGVPASASGVASAEVNRPSGEVAPATVVALAGDTMWTIAHRHRGDEPHGRFLDALIRINQSASISAGQVVILP